MSVSSFALNSLPLPSSDKLAFFHIYQIAIGIRRLHAVAIYPNDKVSIFPVWGFDGIGGNIVEVEPNSGSRYLVKVSVNAPWSRGQGVDGFQFFDAGVFFIQSGYSGGLSL